jgi:hypothetical protein
LYGRETKEKGEQSETEAKPHATRGNEAKAHSSRAIGKASVSNLIEIMADERWEKLAEREGVDYAKTVAEIAGLKGLRADKEADRKVFRREILERVLKFKKR